MIALIVIGSVIFVTVVVLVIVILLHRRKPKITFETADGKKKEVVDNVLFQKAVNPIHTEDISQDDSKVEDISYNDNSHEFHSPTRMETNNVMNVD